MDNVGSIKSLKIDVNFLRFTVAIDWILHPSKRAKLFPNWNAANVKSQFWKLNFHDKKENETVGNQAKQDGLKEIWIAVGWIINKELLHVRNPVSKNVSYVETDSRINRGI